MKRKAILNLDDLLLDKKVKIQGTQYDRKRRLNDKDLKKIQKLLTKRGFTLDEVAALYNVDKRTIRYHLDEDYRRIRIEQSTGKHTGIDVYTFANRVEYKRYLIQKRKIKAKTII